MDDEPRVVAAAGTLYVVATPLGNLEDFSPRAVRILREVSLIACEDTRHTGRLLAHFQIATPRTSYHEHNESAKAKELLAELHAGKSLALVSDAGTPLLSDPGYRLVRLCREQEIPVLPVPGPSAAIAALSVAGIPSDRFLFLGFLPRKAAAQKEELRRVARLAVTLVCYLSPHGLVPTLGSIREIFGARKAFLVREMTKLYETSYFGSLDQILEWVAEEEPRGEYTLVIEGAQPDVAEPSAIDAKAYVEGLIATQGLSRKEALRQAAHELGIPKRELYKLFI